MSIYPYYRPVLEHWSFPISSAMQTWIALWITHTHVHFKITRPAMARLFISVYLPIFFACNRGTINMRRPEVHYRCQSKWSFTNFQITIELNALICHTNHSGIEYHYFFNYLDGMSTNTRSLRISSSGMTLASFFYFENTDSATLSIAAYCSAKPTEGGCRTRHQPESLSLSERNAQFMSLCCVYYDWAFWEWSNRSKMDVYSLSTWWISYAWQSGKDQEIQWGEAKTSWKAS